MRFAIIETASSVACSASESTIPRPTDDPGANLQYGATPPVVGAPPVVATQGGGGEGGDAATPLSPIEPPEAGFAYETTPEVGNVVRYFDTVTNQSVTLQAPGRAFDVKRAPGSKHFVQLRKNGLSYEIWKGRLAASGVARLAHSFLSPRDRSYPSTALIDESGQAYVGGEFEAGFGFYDLFRDALRVTTGPGRKAVTASGSRAPTPFAARGGSVAFSTATQSFVLFSGDATETVLDGSVTTLTSPPSLSPNGECVAYERSFSPRTIAVQCKGGEGTVPLGTSGKAIQSTEGDRLVWNGAGNRFVALDETSTGVSIANRSGGVWTVTTASLPPGAKGTSLLLSPDETHAFVSVTTVDAGSPGSPGSPDRSEFVSISVASAPPVVRPLAAGYLSGFGVGKADKRLIAVRVSTTRALDVILLSANGDIQSIFTPPAPAFIAGVKWSPDGEWIAIRTRKTTLALPTFSYADEVFVVRRNGTELRKVSQDGLGKTTDLGWSGTSEAVAFAEANTMYVVRIAPGSPAPAKVTESVARFLD